MRCVVMETQIMIYDRVVCVVRFDQVLECSRALFGGGFDVMDLNGGDVDCLVISDSWGKEGW